MFGLNKKRPSGQEIVLQIEGMHCSSCAMSIDGELEDTVGIVSATTSYAKSQTSIIFDPETISIDEIKAIVSKLGYKASINN